MTPNSLNFNERIGTEETLEVPNSSIHHLNNNDISYKKVSSYTKNGETFHRVQILIPMEEEARDRVRTILRMMGVWEEPEERKAA